MSSPLLSCASGALAALVSVTLPDPAAALAPARCTMAPPAPSLRDALAAAAPAGAPPPSAGPRSEPRARARRRRGPAAPEPTLAALLQRVQRTYSGRTLQASFVQRYTDAITGERPAEQGQLWAAGDGRVRFDYESPTAKRFVFDGNVAAFIEPEAAQATLVADFAQGPAARALGFLWGQGSLDTAFVPTLAGAEAPLVPPLAPGEVALVLTPLHPLAGVQRVALVLDQRQGEVHRMVLEDPLHNRTTYTLERRRLGEPLGPETFALNIPEGVSVLRTSAAAPGAQAPAADADATAEAPPDAAARPADVRLAPRSAP